MSENETNDNETTKLYELGVNLIPTLEDKTQEEFDSLKQLIEKKGGKVGAFSVPVSIPLAYTMAITIDSKKQKYDTASFGWIKFTAPSEAIIEIKEDIDLNTNVLRHVILKTTEDADTDAKEVAEALEEAPIEEEKPRRKAKPEGDSEEKTGEVVEIDEEAAKEAESKEEVKEEAKEEIIDEKVDEAIDELVEEEK